MGTDAGRCLTYPGDGVPTRISGQTKQYLDVPRVATNGATTVVAWSASTGARSYVTAHWAALQNGAVVGNGALPGDTANAQLLPYGGDEFLYFGGSYASRYADGGFAPISGLSGSAFAVSGTRAMAVSGGQFNGAVRAVVYDGGTVSAPHQISSARALGNVGGDGAGNFGVVTIDRTTFSSQTVHFTYFDGANWADSVVTTGSPNVSDVHVAYGASTWAIAYTVSSNVTVWTRSGTGTWTSFNPNFYGADVKLRGAPYGFCLLGGSSTSAAVFTAGAWTITNLGSGGNDAVEPYGTNGWVVVFGLANQAMNVRRFDGSTWLAAEQVVATQFSGGRTTIAVNGAQLAIGYSRGLSGFGLYTPYVSTYDGTSWSAPYALSTVQFGSSGAAGVTTSVGGKFVVVYPEPGEIRWMEKIPTAWGTPLALPMVALSGMVRDRVALVRGANGRLLATWSQYDSRVVKPYAAEFNGTSWGAAVQVDADGSHPTAAFNGTTFLLGWTKGDQTRQVARWTGAGISTPVSLGTFGNNSSDYLVHVASNGSGGFAAVWDDRQAPSTALQLFQATSADGITWTTPALLEASPGANFRGIASGPAGVLAWSWVSGGGTTARVWSGGNWSAGSPAIGSTAVSPTCRGAVGTADLMLVCAANTMLGVTFANGAWTTTAPPTSGGGTNFSLGTNGAEYRLDYPYNPFPLRSTVYSIGTWSTPVTDVSSPVLNTSPQTNWTAGGCGYWSLIYTDGSQVVGGVYPQYRARATGSAAYAPGATTVPGAVRSSGFGDTPGATDAFWVVPPTGESAPALFVARGL